MIKWWVLARMFWRSDSPNIPFAIGPYPSENLCRLAARSMMPSDRQFWTSEEREAAEQEDKRRADAYEAEVERARASLGGKAGKVTLESSLTTIEFNAEGKQVGWISSGSGTYVSSRPPEPIALSGCVAIEAPAPPTETPR